MRLSVLATTISVVALLAGASLAQTAPLRIGANVSGALDGSDRSGGSERDGRYRYEDYRFDARRGQRLEAILRSDSFDAYLEVFAAGRDGPDGEALAYDDDGLGNGTDSRLRFVAPQNGSYILRARTLSGLDGGAYSLSLAERPAAARAPRPAGIRVGAPVNGTISDRDPESDENGGHYRAYAFRAAAGQRVAISLSSSDFDSMVRVGQMEGTSFIELASNDDGGEGLDSYLVFTAPQAGEFVIRAGPLGEDDGGAFVLKLDNAPPPLAKTPIRIGDKVEGELSDNDGLNDNGVRADAYTFSASAGQRVDITLNSDAFDTYLELFNPAGQSIATDDDGGEEGTNSRLFATLKSDGEYTVQARSYDPTSRGAYTLAIAAAAPEPDPSALPFATLTQGEIKSDGGRDDEGRAFNAYTFTGTAGTRVQIVMRSGDFDTYLQISKAGEFDALASDDDGLGEGTDSRLNFIIPETGEYVVRASPYGSSEKGLYSIELTDRGPQPQPGSILIGATARGTLSDSDGLADDGAYFDAYTIRVSAGDKLNVTLVSNDFDAYLDIGRDSGGSWESLLTDDDSLSDTHAKIEWTVEQAGTYIIRARSFAQGATGSYALAVERRK